MATYANNDQYLTPECGKTPTLDHYDVVYSKDSPNSVLRDDTAKPPIRYTRAINKDEQAGRPKGSVPTVLTGVGAIILVFGLLLLAGFISGYILYSTMIKDVVGELKVAAASTLEKVNTIMLDTQTASCSCPPGWFLNTSTCYIIGREKMTYEKAFFSCRNKSAYLASPKERSDNEFLKRAILEGGTNGNVWLGLTRNWGGRKWLWYFDQSEVTYNGWGGTEPNDIATGEHCSVFYDSLDYAWGDYPCNWTFVSLCEKRTYLGAYV